MWDMASVYILYSKSLDRFYIGSCKNVAERISQHLSGEFSDAFTSKTRDWETYFYIHDLGYEQARKIEFHIKQMKSRQYLINLKRYPEIALKLIDKYKNPER